MKKTSWMALCAALGLALTGCVTEEHHDYADGSAPRAPREWYKPKRDFGSDGYSFNYDPYDHDALIETLALDPPYAPAPLPYNEVDWYRPQHDR